MRLNETSFPRDPLRVDKKSSGLKKDLRFASKLESDPLFDLNLHEAEKPSRKDNQKKNRFSRSTTKSESRN